MPQLCLKNPLWMLESDEGEVSWNHPHPAAHSEGQGAGQRPTGGTRTKLPLDVRPGGVCGLMLALSSHGGRRNRRKISGDEGVSGIQELPTQPPPGRLMPRAR